MQTEKLMDLKKLTQHYTRDQGSCDDAQISYLESLEERDCYIFLTYHCAHNGLSLGPSSLLRHTLPSRTDYDSYTSV
jgi:hypothetical protein